MQQGQDGDSNACENGVSYGGVVNFPAEYEECFDLSGIQDLADELQALSSTNLDCYQCTPNSIVGGDDICVWDGECFNEKRARAGELLDEIQNESVPARANRHCMPLPSEDANNFNDPNHYEEMGPRFAGRGCGGVRAKVAFTGDESVLIHSGMKWSEMRPVIVEDGVRSN